MRHNMKATHQGTCQVCGRRQKLPGDMLSAHGYTVQWSCFVGTCWGSGHAPFEVAIDLIQNAIERAEANAHSLTLDAAAAEAETDHVWINEFIRSTRLGPIYEWRHLQVGEVKVGYDVEYVGKDDRRHRAPTYGKGIAYLNKQYADHLRRLAQKNLDYAAWQRRRIDGWKPHPEKLVPIK